MNGYVRKNKWVYIFLLGCGIFSTSLHADRGFNAGGGFYHGGGYSGVSGGFYHGDEYYHDDNYYNGNGPGWGGSNVIINGGAYAPAYNPACRWVPQCDDNDFCEQRQVCN